MKGLFREFFLPYSQFFSIQGRTQKHTLMTTPFKKWPWLAFLLVLLISPQVVSGKEAPQAFWLQGQIVVAVKPLSNEGYIQMARRLMSRPENYQKLIAFNGKRPVMTGRSVRMPLLWLPSEAQGDILRKMYPDDELTERGWAHRVTDPLETLIHLTRVYTGSSGRYRQLGRYNRLKNLNRLRQDTLIHIPLAWIPETLGLRPYGLKPPLKLVRDRKTGKDYAVYLLKKNETLYSILLRFTDRERADELKRMAGLLVRLNGYRRVTSIPANKPLRFPVEWLDEEFIQKKHRAPPRKKKTRPRTRIARNRAVHVIIDPGHGGVDPGAVYGSKKRGDLIYEHEVVYDIALRLAKRLVALRFSPHLTVADYKQRLPSRTLNTKNLGGERVLVNPPYKIQNTDVGVNMRIYLIDSIFKKLRKKGIPAENIILISIHGDALVKSLQGAMVYYPDYRLRTREFSPRGRIYRIRKEAVPTAIRFVTRNNKEAEALSEDFALEITRAMKAHSVGVARRKPVRSYYYRKGVRTLPGVLRYSRVPASVLVEVANLNNASDRKKILQPKMRERIAKSLASAISVYRRKNSSLVLGTR